MDGQRAAVISAIQDYREYLEFENDFYYGSRKYTLKAWSYVSFTIEYILERLSEEEKTPPLVLLEDYAEKFHRYSKVNPENEFIFSVARDTVGEITDLLS